ncbi:MAG: ribonuclease H-like domain-containing protein [Salinirussus sp.]
MRRDDGRDDTRSGDTAGDGRPRGKPGNATTGDGETPATRTPLPPPDAEPARLLGVPGSVAQQFEPADVIADAVTGVEPDAVVAAPPDANVVEPALAGAVDFPVLRPGRGMRVRTLLAGDVVVAVPPSPEALPTTPGALDTGAEGPVRELDRPGEQCCLVTEDLQLAVDPHRCRARLDGVSSYVDALSPAWLGEDVTHLSTAVRAGHGQSCRVDGGPDLPVHGLGTGTERLGVGTDSDPSLAAVSVYPNGAVEGERLDPSRYGLRGLDRVSDTRARRLRAAGFEDRATVAAADPGALADLSSVGRATATRIRASARAVAEDRVVRTGDGSLPDGQPVFVDVETDGLSASTAWLIGVLDGRAEGGTYLAFRQRDPREPAAHLDAFVTWLTGSAAGRPVVAWNGHGFDFDVIADQLRQHCPEFADDWRDRYLFDPLYWADGQGNAALPGRTNQLAAVAEPLGWTPATQGLNGATVARRYVAWRTRVERADDPTTVPAPDWDRFEAYCEDDVRALATVYEALEAAAGRPRDPDAQPRPEAETGSTTGNTTQGSLADFT